MTNKEKDFINTLAKKVLRISQEQEAEYEDLTKTYNTLIYYDSNNRRLRFTNITYKMIKYY